MFTQKKLEGLIELDGGIPETEFPQPDRIGWKYEPSSAKQREIESKYGISYWSYFFLHAYTWTLNYRLNEALRKQNTSSLSELYKKCETCLNELLDDMLPFEHQKVIRWTYLTNNKGANLLKDYIGKSILRPDFTNASKHPNPSHDYFFHINTCKDSNCKDIEPIVKKEEHVLFKSRTVFRINSCEQNVFHLEEIKSDEWDLELVENFWE